LWTDDDGADGVAAAGYRRRDSVGDGTLRDGLDSRDESEEVMR
jgi:hypothetical protein